MKLGRADLHRIPDIDPFRLPLDFLFPGARLDDLAPHRAALEGDHVDFATGEVLLGVQSFVVRVGGLNVLIDTCVGEHKERPRRADWHRRTGTGYLAALASAGFGPGDIDVVLCTHLHADHVGWNTRLDNGRWVPTFPRARYMVGRDELDHWQAEERRAPGVANHGVYADSVLPIEEAGMLERVAEGFEVARGLSVVRLPGHTPGQVGLDLDDGAGRHVLFCGDAIHSPAQVWKPDWTSAFCSDPAQAVATRVGLLERAAGDGSLLVPAHIRGSIGFGVRACGCGAYDPAFVAEAA